MVPYKEFFVQYGLLTTLIHSIGLKLFGNSIVSVGVITGFFYSANIFLSYLLWQKILNKWFSASCALIMLLIHPHIAYPWSNYIAYTFLLLALLCLTSTHRRNSLFILAGLFWSLSTLTRQTYIIFILPLALYMLGNYFVMNTSEKRRYPTWISSFALSSATVFAVFFSYLLHINSFEDWYLQSVKVVRSYNAAVGSSSTDNFMFIVNNLIRNLTGLSDPRLSFYSILFLFAGGLLIGIVVSIVKKTSWFQYAGSPPGESKTRTTLLLYTLVVIVGFTQSMPVYETWRLQSSSSLGIGLLVFCLHQLWLTFFPTLSLNPLRLNRRKKFIAFSSVGLILILLLTAAQPWKKLSGMGGEGEGKRGRLKQLINGTLNSVPGMSIFNGKLYDQETIDFYVGLKSTIDQYTPKLDYIVNFTKNSNIFYLNNKIKRLQRAPFYVKNFDLAVFPGESQLVNRMIAERRVIIVAESQDSIPDSYCVVFKKDAPYPAIVAVPRSVANQCKVA
ncbi:MAG: glycosyltransferase family 39 protein [Cyanobacteriota bacterium]|nr:glycosyltransferase family 39 protein [Cyanobacteriota bacterium]